MDYLESIKKLEEKWIMNQQKQHSNNGSAEGRCNSEVLLA